jgi:hypothetical protein
MKSCWRSAGLGERDVSEPGLHVLPHRLDVLAGIRAARHQRRDVVLGDMLGGGLLVAVIGGRQLAIGGLARAVLLAGEGLPDDLTASSRRSWRTRAAGQRARDVLVEIWSVPVPDIAVNAG